MYISIRKISNNISGPNSGINFSAICQRGVIMYNYTMFTNRLKISRVQIITQIWAAYGNNIFFRTQQQNVPVRYMCDFNYANLSHKRFLTF